MLNLTRLHLGIAHESQFQGLGIRREAKIISARPSPSRKIWARTFSGTGRAPVPQTRWRFRHAALRGQLFELRRAPPEAWQFSVKLQLAAAAILLIGLRSSS